MKKICKFLATGFNVGYIPGAPGTYGALIAAAFYLAVHNLSVMSYVIFCVGFSFFSFWVIKNALSSFESGDPKEIVIDEIAGMFVAMIGHPFSWLYLGIGFVLFRFFDVVKPPPICWLDRKVKGALGVLLDDIAAGVFACATLWIIRFFV